MNQLAEIAKGVHAIGQDLSLSKKTLDLGGEWTLEPRVCLMHEGAIIADIGDDWQHAVFRGMSTTEMDDLLARLKAVMA